MTPSPTRQDPVAPRRGAAWRARREAVVAATRGHRAWLAVAALAAIALALSLRGPIAERIWPEPRAGSLREAAGRALSAGRLTAGDGTGARELYEAALALDPDDRAARVGLSRVAAAAVVQARVAVERHDYIAAHRALALARALSAPRAQVDGVAEALRRREVQGAGIGDLLRQADVARAAGDLDGGPSSALPIYARVLALQPDDEVALAGRGDAVADLLQQGREAAGLGRVADAADRIRRARAYDPGHPDLPDSQAALLLATERRRAVAERALDDGALDAALAGFREVLLANPADARAAEGIARVAATWAGRATRHAADFRFAPAMAALDRARAIDPESPALARAEAAVRRARDAHARLRPATPLPAPERQARLRASLAGVEAAIGQGHWLEPPGDSAFDRLRAARAIAPEDPSVHQAGQALTAAARGCFVRELRANNLGVAGECLSLRVELGDEAAGLAADRRQLALRWIAVGDERLGAGELGNARRALERARAIDPGTPGLQAFAGRLAAADVGGQ